MSLFIDPQIVSIAEHSPGCCRSCQSSSRGWFIDTGYIEEFWGRVYWCNACFDQLARLAKYEPVDFSKIVTLLEENAYLSKKLEDYDSLLDGLRSAGVDLGPFLDYVGHPHKSEEFQQSFDGMGSRKDEPVEQDHGERSNDAPISTGTLSF